MQTFPDDYVFVGGKESVRRQIGMAIPPEGMKHILMAVLKTFAGVDYIRANLRNVYSLKSCSLLILRLYYSFDLADHLTIYLERDQATYLCEYLKLFLHKREKSPQELFDAGILQGD